MKVRRYQPSDYETLCSWWKEYNHLKIPQRYLSETGFIIDNHAAVFLYETKSTMAWLEFLVGNPMLLKSERTQAIDELLQHVIQYCADKGYEVLNTGVQLDSVQNKFKDLGFVYTENSNIKFMVKFIQGVR